MSSHKLTVLLIVEQCNPAWSSVPLEGYKYFQEISKLANVTLVTHERNKKNLSEIREHQNIIYISESRWLRKYYKLVEPLTKLGRINWPLYHALMYPIYAEFNQKTYTQFKDAVLRQDYDIVHAITPMMPRYPVKIAQACQKTPFILGPVNGGIPFPAGFQEKAKAESAQFNFLKRIGRALIPGYIETYKKANKILMGSTYTFQHLQDLFNLKPEQSMLFYENGMDQDFLKVYPKTQPSTSQQINLIFVGRLVPYKCADILIEAISQLSPSLRKNVKLTIVGDGSEKKFLENLVSRLNLNHLVTFTGWVEQKETLNYYKQADIFCFPSIREFGGAVVLEAMACGLPCIVTNYGGIGEYVTEETGFKIDPISKDYLRQEFTQKIEHLAVDHNLRHTFSEQARKRAAEFTWENKAQKIVDLYDSLIDSKQQSSNRH